MHVQFAQTESYGLTRAPPPPVRPSNASPTVHIDVSSHSSSVTAEGSFAAQSPFLVCSQPIDKTWTKGTVQSLFNMYGGHVEK